MNVCFHLKKKLFFYILLKGVYMINNTYIIKEITQKDINKLERTFIQWNYENDDYCSDTIVFRTEKDYKDGLNLLRKVK